MAAGEAWGRQMTFRRIHNQQMKKGRAMANAKKLSSRALAETHWLSMAKAWKKSRALAGLVIEDFACCSLCFFQPRILLDQLLLPEAGETDGQLRRIACAFAAQDEAAPVFRVADVRAGAEVAACG